MRRVSRDFRIVNHECSHTESTVKSRVVLRTVSSIRLTRTNVKKPLTNVKKKKPNPYV